MKHSCNAHHTGKLRYINDTRYRSDGRICKEVQESCSTTTYSHWQLFVGRTVIDEFKRIVSECEIQKESDEKWPQPDSADRQELVVVLDDHETTFKSRKLGIGASKGFVRTNSSNAQ